MLTYITLPVTMKMFTSATAPRDDPDTWLVIAGEVNAVVGKTREKPWENGGFNGKTMGLLWFNMAESRDYTGILMDIYGYIYISSGNLLHSYWVIENGPVEIVDLPTNSMVMFNSKQLEKTRGYIQPPSLSHHYPIIIPYLYGEHTCSPYLSPNLRYYCQSEPRSIGQL